MSSSLRLFPALPSNLRTYVSATISGGPDVNEWTVDTAGDWTATPISGKDISETIYEDLGKVVFHDPVVYATNPSGTPLVDVRKIREVSADGKITVGSEIYASLGTRVKDVNGVTSEPIEPCWFGLNASGTVGRL